MSITLLFWNLIVGKNDIQKTRAEKVGFFMARENINRENTVKNYIVEHQEK